MFHYETDSFGNNSHWDGKNKSANHIDCIIHDPTIVGVEQDDGHTHTLIREGEHVYRVRTKLTQRVQQSIEYLVNEVLGLSRGQSLLLILDRERYETAEAIRLVCENLDITSTLCPLSLFKRPLHAIPKNLKHLIESADGIMNLLQRKRRERNFRIDLLKYELSRVPKVIHAPTLTLQSIEYGTATPIPSSTKDFVEEFLSEIKKHDCVSFNTQKGTEFRFPISNFSFHHDLNAQPGLACVIPNGKIFCVPKVYAGEGDLVLDGISNLTGKLSDQLRISLAAGKIDSFECDNDFERTLLEISMIEEGNDRLSAIGFGVRKGRKKVASHFGPTLKGTGFVCFGANKMTYGGEIQSNSYREYSFHKPSVTLHKEDQSKTIVLSGVFMEDTP